MGCRLGDICKKIGSGATPRGGKESYQDEGISLIRSQNVLDFSFSVDGLAYISDSQADQLSNVIVESKDVLLNITGDSVARTCIVPDEMLPARVNQHVAIVRPDSNKADNRYILYFLQSTKQHLLQIASAGATRNALTKSMIEDLELVLPPLPEQATIAKTLSCLDDKIELNNRINKTLEEMAQAIFKRWFVDFEFPNEEGLPYKYSGGAMVDSELGEIPQGWRVAKIEDVCDINSQQYSTAENWDYINYLDTSNITANVIEKYQCFRCETDKVPSRAKRKIDVGDIVYSTVRPIQRHYGIIKNPPCNVIVSTGFAVIHSNNSNISTEQVYLNLINKNTVEKLQQIAETTTSTYPAIKPSDIASLTIICADNKIGIKFGEVLSSMFNTMAGNNLENQTLTTIRDALLPKLMSGEIRVPVGRVST